jgi:hypothetical protein
MPHRSLSNFSGAHHHAGVLVSAPSVADSGNTMHRRFCPRCGTQVFSTLDDREVARPAATIWTSQAPSWASIDPSLPCIAEQPQPAA